MPASHSNRLIGIDFAYALALLGCVVFCFSYTIPDKVQNALSHTTHVVIMDLFPALFFFLNGMTVTLTMRDRRISNRKLLAYLSKRGSVLLLLGLACCTIWPMNIFIASGLFYVMSPMLGQWNNILLRVATFIVLSLGVLLILMDTHTSTAYELPNFGNGEFLGVCGFFLFNGYFSVIPWFVFFCGGLLHGRTDVKPKGWLPPSSLIGIALIASSFILQYYSRKFEMITDDVLKSDIFILNIHLMMPAFVAFALGSCIVLVNAFIYFFRKVENARVVKFVQTMSSQKYSVLFFHMLIGIITLLSSNRPFFQKKLVLGIYLVLATFLTIYLTVQWRKRVSEKGPMEWLIKRISGSAKN